MREGYNLTIKGKRPLEGIDKKLLMFERP